MHEVQLPKLSNEKIKSLIQNLLGEARALLCDGNKRSLHSGGFLIRAWADEGLAEASWLKSRERSMSDAGHRGRGVSTRCAVSPGAAPGALSAPLALSRGAAPGAAVPQPCRSSVPLYQWFLPLDTH